MITDPRMAIREQSIADGADGETVPSPMLSNQENKDPGALRKMFYEGMTNIDTHRTANLFEALERRNLTAAEQSVIDERVAHQRKMYELFEKREKERKVAELREVCPDMDEKEVATALEMCNGREDEAATALVSDPSFKRRVKIACGTAPAPQPRQAGGGGYNWAARPNGPRPKLIDPATLGNSVFVGNFRGKGFQGVSKGVKAAQRGTRRTATHAAALAYESDEDTLVDEDDSNAEEIDEQQIIENDNTEPLVDDEATAHPLRHDVNEHQGSPSLGGPTTTPPTTGPKTYALVADTGEGKVRPVTDSELKRAVSGLRGDDQDRDGTLREGALVTDQTGSPAPQSQSQSQHHHATRPPSQRERRTAISDEVLDTMVIKIVTLSDDKAVAWLGKMAAPTAAAILQRLGDEDPERAVDLRERMDAEQQQQLPAEDAIDAAGALAARKSPRLAAAKTVSHAVAVNEENPEDEGAGWDSEATLSDGSAQAKRRERRSRYPQRKADDVAGEIKELPGSKRRKSVDGAPDGVQGSPPQPDAVAGPSSAPAPLLAPIPSGRRPHAISSRGHTNRGRVKQKSHKAADLVEAGTLCSKAGWYNAGYIFPEGFQSRTLFRSSVSLDQLCVHECFILGKEGGKYWPAPTFKVVALDRPEEPLIAKSCTGCWTGVLKRINAEIEARRRDGEDLPPPPKTAIAGPEYFGLNQPNIQEAIEALDPDQLCTEYWGGKQDRQLAADGLPVASTAVYRAPRVPRMPRGTGGTGGGGRRRRGSGNNSDSEGRGAASGGGDDDETQYMTNRWSAVSRGERYRKRLKDSGEDMEGLEIDPDNPMPDLIDPITLEPVQRPAMSPYGHVMGAATWRAVLAESSGVCPFTKQPLRWEQCRMLTKHNIDAFRDQIIR